MKNFTVLFLFIAGCATQQGVALMPRGPGQQGTGTFDHVHQVLTVELNGNRYKGIPITQTSTSRIGLFGPATDTSTNQETALLIGERGGQLRCDFMWGGMRAQAVGSCVDSNNVVYDMQIKN